MVPAARAYSELDGALRPLPGLCHHIPHGKVVPRESDRHRLGLPRLEHHVREALENRRWLPRGCRMVHVQLRNLIASVSDVHRACVCRPAHLDTCNVAGVLHLERHVVSRFMKPVRLSICLISSAQEYTHHKAADEPSPVGLGVLDSHFLIWLPAKSFSISLTFKFEYVNVV